MRFPAIRCALILFVASCGSETVIIHKSPDLGGFVGAGDMSLPIVNPNPDLSLPVGVKVGCNGYGTCMIGCLQDASATLAGCQTTCGKQAKTNAPTEWQAAFGCGQGWCLNKNVMN